MLFIFIKTYFWLRNNWSLISVNRACFCIHVILCRWTNINTSWLMSSSAEDWENNRRVQSALVPLPWPLRGISSNTRRYADRSMRQMKTSQFDFFGDVCGKKFMKCPRVLSLLRGKGLNLGNKQSTILCVLRQQIFIIQCVFSPDLRVAAQPSVNNLFPNR